MNFSRTLSPPFIDALNNLYDSEESWWRTIVDDKDVFILIRRNEIRVQANGGWLLQITQDQQRKKLICKVREDFICLPSEKDPYITIDEDFTASTQRVNGLKGFVKHYDKIKRRISIFTSKEKQAVQYLANNIQNVVDIEIGFEDDIKDHASRKSAPRIDMAAMTDNGTLVFFEVKLFNNSEIRSKEKPKVVDQLEKYVRLLAKYDEDIVAGYKEQLKIYSQLKGSFFENRSRSDDRIDLYQNPRLIITGFDASQQNKLPSFMDRIATGIGWVKGSEDLIGTGHYRSLAKSNRLFLGLK